MLHPQCQALIDDFTRLAMPPTYTLAPVEAKLAFAQRCVATQLPSVVEVTTRALNATAAHGDIPVRLYRPAMPGHGGPLPVCLYFHGGGWVVGDLDTHDNLCRQLAHASGCAIVAVHYRLAPEHRFPGAVEDAVAALHWVRATAPTLGLDVNRIAIAGDSAGGGLATVVAIVDRERDTKVAPLHYAPASQQQLDWRASPVLHPALSGLPPALVITAGYDPLRDEGQAYARRLSDAGVSVESVCFDQQVHGFVLMTRRLDEASVAVKLCADRLQRAL